MNWLYIDNAKMHLKHKMIAEPWSLISDGALGTGNVQLVGCHSGTPAHPVQRLVSVPAGRDMLMAP